MENQKSCKPKFNIENYLMINKKPHYLENRANEKSC